MRIKAAAPLLALAALCASQPALGAEITNDATWSGVVVVKEDTRVGKNATLTVLAGTRVIFQPAESTKTEPSFWSPETELAVEGRLLVKGEEGKPVAFVPESGVWGGVIVAPGARAEIRYADLTGADEALLLAGGSVAVENLRIGESAVGLVLGPKSKLAAKNLAIANCARGVVDLTGEAAQLPEGVTVSKSGDADLLHQPWMPREAEKVARIQADGPAREFVGEYTVYGEETWSGLVILNGRVTVPPGSTLKIAPGARVLFRKRDTNGDGLGEGELLILGSVRCLGTKESPVIFDSAEETPAPGDWDKVSIISSEDNENAFRHAIFRHGTMALHAHFSTFAASDCRFERNLRALQFQESEKALVERSVFVDNKQAMRFRDSNVTVKDCQLYGNDYAFHVFRSTVAISGCKIEDTLYGGLLAKESRLTVTGNAFERSRAAMKLKGEGSTLAMSGNRVAGNVENALSLQEVKARVERNVLDGAGLDLVGLEGGDPVFRANNFGKSGRDAIHLNSRAGADASCNDWGGADPAKRIHHYVQNNSLGVIVLNGKCD